MILQKKLHKIRKEPSEIETEIKNVESISRGSFVKKKGCLALRLPFFFFILLTNEFTTILSQYNYSTHC